MSRSHLETYVVLHRSPRPLAEGDSLICLVMVPSETFKSLASLNQACFDFFVPGMERKWVCHELCDRLRSRELGELEDSIAIPELLAIPVDMLASQLIESAACVLAVLPRAQTNSTRFIILRGVDDGARLKDEPCFVKGNDVVGKKVVTSFDLVSQLLFKYMI